MLLWIEGFESFGNTNGNSVDGIQEKYPSSATFTATRVRDGRIVGKCLSHEDPFGNVFVVTTPNLGTMNTVVTGFAVQFVNTVSSVIPAAIMVELREEDNSTQGINLRVKADGALEIYRASTLLATSTAGIIQLNAWYYIEMKVLVHSSGTYEVRVNGDTVLSGNANTQQGASAHATNVRLVAASLSANRATQFDDWYVLDDGAGLDDFLGDQVVLTIFPNAPGDSTDFTPNSGDNYAAVDDNPIDDDTSYVESDTPGDLDLYNFSGVSLEDIKGVQLNAVVRKTDTDNFDVNLVVKSGETTDSGDPQSVSSTSYLNKYRVLEEDPDTEAAWTSEGVSGAQFGVEIDS